MRRTESFIIPGKNQQTGAPMMEYLCPNPKCKVVRDFIGQIPKVDLSVLSCLKKPAKKKVSLRLDGDLLATIRKIAKKHKVSCSELMNEVLRKAFGLP